MIDRRELLTLGGLLGALAPSGAPAEGIGTAQLSDRQVGDLASALAGIATAITREHNFDAVVPIRTRQNDYLRANAKFPDFIDVALDVWMNVYDWHIRLQQPLVLGRDVSGRYTLMLGFTALVLRQDAAPSFIGIPYDNR
jgi:hypothetical protein